MVALLATMIYAFSQVRQQRAAEAVTSWSQVSTGQWHSCALTPAGKAYCWGDNAAGQLGDGTSTTSTVPKAVSGALTFSTIETGYDHTCALTSAGAAYCWGAGGSGQMGDGTNVSKNVPTAVSGGVTFSSVSAGFGSACGIRASDGITYCWGYNGNGQLGDNSTSSRNVPTATNGGIPFSSVWAGQSATCAIRSSNNAAYCWGNNAFGQLGDASQTQRIVPTAVSGGLTFSKISIGQYSACAIRLSNSAAYCWGDNFYGQLGDGTTTLQTVPTSVAGGMTFNEITVARHSACAKRISNSQGYCWGRNLDGQLGVNDEADRATPTVITGGNAIAGLTSSGSRHCTRFTSNNAIACWGQNEEGGIGDGTDNLAETPLAVTGGLTFASISAGANHTCGLTAAGVAYCWGENDEMQLGTGSTTKAIAPTPVSGGLTFASISAGAHHTCAVTTSTFLAYCWGENLFGGLGDNSTTNRSVPTAVSSGIAFSKISVGDYHTCAIRQSNSRAYCWGANSYGDIGDNTNVDKLVPTATSGGLSYSEISSGFNYTCALTTANSPRCWGYNTNGQLGDNSITDRWVPTALSGGNTFSKITTNADHTCGVHSSTSLVYCWGKNDRGQVGDNTTVDKWVPTATSGGYTFSTVNAGRFFTCATTPSNTTRCWGNNAYSQLGDGTVVNKLVPTTAASTLSLSSVVGATDHACGLTTGNAAYCWGRGYMGSLGTGAPDHWSPIQADFPPEDPVSLAQYKSDGTTSISANGWTNTTTNIIRATLTDTDASQDAQLCVEIDVIATAFSNTEDSCGSAVLQGNIASVSVSVTNTNSYHWQVRTKDELGAYSGWTQFNSNATAFTVDTVAPGSPSALAQYKSDGTTGLSTGAWSSDLTTVLKATVTDAAAPVAVCVEFKTLGSAFTNTNSACGSTVTSGSTASTSFVMTDNSEYHWQARSLDAAGNYSGWASYGANAESARDVGTDTTAPTSGAVYDGSGIGVDAAWNTGSLSTLSTNWSFNNNVSGISRYDYAVGTTAGATDIVSWTSNGTSTTASPTGLVLRTSQPYYVSVRAIDNAGNTSTAVNSNGQYVAPTLTFGVSTNTVTFDRLNPGNSYTSATKTVTATTNTNGYGGFTVKQWGTTMSKGAASIPNYAGTYASPTTWSGTGYGYTSDDTTIGGSNKFSSGTKFAALATTGPGDIVADHTTAITGSPVNQSTVLTYKLQANAAQPAGDYTAAVHLAAIATF